jgi:hypothetical protein
MTTVSFAQDMNVDSRTRIDMSGDNENMSTDQRVSVGTTWGGDTWGIVLSSDVNYTTNGETNANGDLNMSVYEAYATTDLFGFATMNIGRQALSYGSGVFVGTNDWNANRNTVDGMTFAVANDFVNLDLGLNSNSAFTPADGETEASTASLDNMWLNASKSSGDWTANLLYFSTTSNDGDANTAMGLDFTYSAMGGALDLNLSYNTTSGFLNADGEAYDGDMIDIKGTYTVNDDMSVFAGMASVGEEGFEYLGSGNMSGNWVTNGNLGQLAADEENLYVGGSYSMGAFSLGATMSTVTNTTDDSYERSATDIVVGYELNDNAAISYRMVTDNNNSDVDTKYNWLTLTVTP